MVDIVLISGLPLARKIARKWQGYFDVQEEIRRKLDYF